MYSKIQINNFIQWQFMYNFILSISLVHFFYFAIINYYIHHFTKMIRKLFEFIKLEFERKI